MERAVQVTYFNDVATDMDVVSSDTTIKEFMNSHSDVLKDNCIVAIDGVYAINPFQESARLDQKISDYIGDESDHITIATLKPADNA